MIDGLEADVVTLALAGDIDAIARAGLIPADWQTRLPNNIDALHLDDRLPGAQGESEGDPRLGGPREAGRLGRHAESEDFGRRALELPRGLGLRAREARRRRRRRATWSHGIFANVPVLDTGARGSTVTFVERGIGDVLIAWENEALLSLREFGAGKFEIVAPSLSILAEPPVADRRPQIVDRRKHARRRAGLPRVPLHDGGAGAGGEALLPAARPGGAAKYAASFPKVELFTIDEKFGGWAKAQTEHFADGGEYDRMQAGAMSTARGERPGRPAGLRAVAGSDAPLPRPRRADSALDGRPSHGFDAARAGPCSAFSDRARSPRTG